MNRLLLKTKWEKKRKIIENKTNAIKIVNNLKYLGLKEEKVLKQFIR